jgi:hypothetical protein
MGQAACLARFFLEKSFGFRLRGRARLDTP